VLPSYISTYRGFVRGVKKRLKEKLKNPKFNRSINFHFTQSHLVILGWCYYGEKCFEYLAGERFIPVYRMVWVVFVYVGAVKELKFVWDFSGAMNALMAIPNLIALLALSRLIARETKEFEKGIGEGAINRFD